MSFCAEQFVGTKCAVSFNIFRIQSARLLLYLVIRECNCDVIIETRELRNLSRNFSRRMVELSHQDFSLRCRWEFRCWG